MVASGPGDLARAVPDQIRGVYATERVIVFRDAGGAVSAVESGALAVRRSDLALDAAADVEVADDLDPAGAGGGGEVVEDTVGDVLVEGALLPVRPEVELQRLQL